MSEPVEPVVIVVAPRGRQRARGGDCTVCHGSYFESHAHHGTSNQVSYSSAIDRSQELDDPSTACDQCHTPAGTKEGNFITLERAMHLKGCEDSCLGCHEINQNEPKCAACHIFMEKGRREEATCLICHMEPIKESAEVKALYNENVMAEMMLQSRKTITSLYKAVRRW